MRLGEVGVVISCFGLYRSHNRERETKTVRKEQL